MIEYKLATRRERFVAFLVDATIGFLLFLTFYYFWGDKSDSSEISVTGLPAFVLFLLNFLIWPVLEGFNGQTIGKKLVGLKVVNDNFKDISMGQAFIRFFVGIIDFNCLLIGLFISLGNKNKKRLGDIAAKTIVIDVKKPIILKQTD